MASRQSDKTRAEELGFFKLCRIIFESPIWSDDPHTLKLWIYLLGTARHAKGPKMYPDFKVKRGELVTSLQQIAENNEYMKFGVLKRWSKSRVSRMLKILENQEYIQRPPDTFGTHVRICNYEFYQDINLPKTNGSGTGAEQVRNRCGTGAGTYKNVKNVKNDKDKESLPEQAKRLSGVVGIVDNFHEYLSKSRFKDYKVVKKHNRDAQVETIEKLNRIDGQSFEVIQKVINFAIKDDFWCDKVISLAEIRKTADNGNMKFENIKLKMDGKPENTIVNNEDIKNSNRSFLNGDKNE